MNKKDFSDVYPHEWHKVEKEKDIFQKNISDHLHRYIQKVNRIEQFLIEEGLIKLLQDHHE